jgi:lysophospholipase L1-like esterase
MSQAYQAPQVSAIEVSEPILPIQRPNPKLLARRAVDQMQRRSITGIQPQRVKVPPQRVKRSVAPRPAAKPIARKVTAQKSNRLPIDLDARLREARQRLAKKAPSKATSKVPSKTAARPKAIARAGSALELTRPTAPDASQFSRSVRRGTELNPVVRPPGNAPTARPAPTADRAARPRSGSQLYAQRLNALRSGQLYTQLPVDSFYDQWSQASGHPSYAQWRELLALEARAAGRSGSQVTAMVGDSLSQWFPADRLPGRQLWLNQGISGDTTTGILDRISFLDNAKPDTIYFMAGVNDLKRGTNERDVLRNISQIITRLKRQHPTAQIIVQSILPTRSEQIPNDRIRKLNPQIQELAQRQGVDYLDLQQQFRDSDGSLRADLTTDGIHLSPQGYQVWQGALQRMDQRLAQRPRTIARADATASLGN